MKAERFCFHCQRYRPVDGFVKRAVSPREFCSACDPERVVYVSERGSKITVAQKAKARHRANARARANPHRGVLQWVSKVDV